jgi:hypothetical protein
MVRTHAAPTARAPYQARQRGAGIGRIPATGRTPFQPLLNAQPLVFADQRVRVLGADRDSALRLCSFEHLQIRPYYGCCDHRDAG